MGGARRVWKTHKIIRSTITCVTAHRYLFDSRSSSHNGVRFISSPLVRVLVHHYLAPRCKGENQQLMADEGGIDMLVTMLDSPQPHLQRQSSKALANLGVNSDNKDRICQAGGVAPLVRLAGSSSPNIAVEAVAALANLAVNGKWGPGWQERGRGASILRMRQEKGM